MSLTLSHILFHLQNRITDLQKASDSVERETKSCLKEKDQNTQQIMDITTRSKDRQQLERIQNNFSRKNEKIDILNNHMQKKLPPHDYELTS